MKKILSTAIALFFAGAIFPILATGPAQQPGPPVAPIRPVTDTFFGHDVVDHVQVARLEDLKRQVAARTLEQQRGG